ncbi:helix-turn-helix domain-containing protein [Clostridium sp.]|uniref:helix-turn-helix domain-containing protein n=1 Tax=Clostridium sp. TaxID=1506 RepID=UPI002F943AEA
MVKILVAEDDNKKVNNFQWNVEKEKFLRKWILGKVKSYNLADEMKKFDVVYSKTMALVVVKPLVKGENSYEIDWEAENLSFAISNIAKEIMSDFKYLNVIVDFKGQVVILCDVNPIKRWHHAVNNLEDNINEKLKVNVVICASFLREDPVQINIVYNSLCNRIIDKSKKSDMLIEVQKYINRNYFNENLSIAEVANVMKVSQAYLIRVFKRDLKMNFADYLTNVRIKNAIILMRDNELKLNDISKMVGYNTQHYFSNVFRKHVGISPQDYRIGMGS